MACSSGILLTVHFSQFCGKRSGLRAYLRVAFDSAHRGWADMYVGCGQFSSIDCHVSFEPTTAKRQKLDVQSAWPKKDGMFPGGLPGVLGAAPPLRMVFPTSHRGQNTGFCYQRMAVNHVQMTNQSSGGDGLLAAPLPCWPNRFPNQNVNGWLLAGNTGCQQSAQGNQHSPAGALPEIPAEQEIDRISSRLDALEKNFHLFMDSLDCKITEETRRKYIQEHRNERHRLQNQIKIERERQQFENAQLSKQLEQQYNFSQGPSPGEVPSAVQKQNEHSALGKSINDAHSGNEAALAECTHKFVTLTCQMSELDRKIEEFEGENDDPWQNELKLKILRNQKKFLKQKLVNQRTSRKRMMTQATETRFGIDPLMMLKRLAKKTRTWRHFKHFDIPIEEEQNGTGVHMQLENGAVKEKGVVGQVELDKSHGHPTRVQQSESDEADAIIIGDDEDEDDDDVIIIDCSAPHQKKQFTARQQKHVRKQRIARHIDRCVAEKGLTTDANQSYFVLSGLAGVLLARQQLRKESVSRARPSRMGTSPQSSTMVSRPRQSCILSQLMGQMTSRLELITQQMATVIMQKAKEHDPQQTQGEGR